MQIKVVMTKAYSDQQPTTTGLTRKVKEFEQKYYLENYIQSIFSSLPKDGYFGKALVVISDGGNYTDVATQKIIQIAFANGVR